MSRHTAWIVRKIDSFVRELDTIERLVVTPANRIFIALASR